MHMQKTGRPLQPSTGCSYSTGSSPAETCTSVSHLCRQSSNVEPRSLHDLVQVASFVGAQRVEGGYHKLPVKGAPHQQPLSLFGVTGVGVLHVNLTGKDGSVSQLSQPQAKDDAFRSAVGNYFA